MRISSPLRRRKVVVGTGLFVTGTATLTLLGLTQAVPRPLWLWALFVLAVALLEWRTVEINHRLTVSPAIMVIIAAGVVFGVESALLGVGVMGAVGFLSPVDIRERRFFQPMANFGQLVLAAVVAIVKLDATAAL